MECLGFSLGAICFVLTFPRRFPLLPPALLSKIDSFTVFPVFRLVNSFEDFLCVLIFST